MVSRYPVASNRWLTVAIVLLACVTAAGAIALAGTKTGMALALLASLGPLAAYGALTAPLLFPFCAFVLLVPFDNLLQFSAFGTVTKLLAIVSGVAIAFWQLRTKRFVIPDRALFYWIAFYVWAVCSLIWALDPQYAMQHVLTLAELLILFAAASMMPIESRTLVIVVGTVVASATIASLYGIYLFHGGNDVSVNGRLFIRSDESVIDPNQFAAALILPFTLALMAVAAAKGTFTRILAFASSVAIAGGIAVAGSRGALLGIALAFCYLFIRSRNRLVLGIIGFGGLGAALVAYANVLTRFSTAGATGGAGRTDIWRVGLSAFRMHPIAGWGFSNFPLAYDRAFLNVYESYYTRWTRAPHNIIVEISVELGIIGIVLLGLAAFKQFRALRFIAPASRLYSLRLALEAGMIGLACASLFLDMLVTKYLWLALILVMFTRNAELTASRTNRSFTP